MRKLPELVVLAGGRPTRREDRRSSAKLSLLLGRPPSKKKVHPSSRVADLYIAAHDQSHYSPLIQEDIQAELFSGSGTYQAKALHGSAIVSIEQSGGSYLVTRKGRNGKIEFMVIENTLRRATRTFTVLWMHLHGPIRL